MKVRAVTIFTNGHNLIGKTLVRVPVNDDGAAPLKLDTEPAAN